MRQQADFYILPSSEHSARMNFVIKLLEQIQSRSLSVLVWLENEDLAAEFDHRLWDYRPDAFLPHHRLNDEQTTASIAITHQQPELPSHDVLVHLALSEKPVREYPRVVEVVIQDELVLTATRRRYQGYKEAGCEVNRHDMRKSPT